MSLEVFLFNSQLTQKLIPVWATFLTLQNTNKIRGFKIFSVTYFFLHTNPFVPNAPFLYPLKTSENLKVFWCFQGVEKRCIGNKWVKLLFRHRSNLKFFFSSAMSEEKFRTKQINRKGYVESEKVLCFSIVSTEKYPKNSSELL